MHLWVFCKLFIFWRSFWCEYYYTHVRFGFITTIAMQKYLVWTYKIFFIWLLLQFFLQTFVTYGIWFEVESIWLWKEWVIAILLLVSLVGIVMRRNWKQIWQSKALLFWTLWLLLAVGITAYLHLEVVGWTPKTYFLAFKYDFLWFFILLAGLHSSALLTSAQRQEVIAWYGKTLKRALLLALVRYLLIIVKPGSLKLFGYDNFVYEGTVGSPPPAAYYTQINYWLARNQFLFERPISWWFFLTALFPLFYMLFLHQQKMRSTWGWWAIYGLNVILTFSRAAWWARVIELVVLGMMTHWWNIKKFMVKFLVPIAVVLISVWYRWFEHIFDRWYSNNGHIMMIEKWREMFIASPLVGQGGATAWPGSHREWGSKFNPENQFLQIMIEFGSIGFLCRFFLYGYLNVAGILMRRKKSLANKKISTPLWWRVAMSIGMVGLSISGLVLHSFTDRMIVYPMMLLMWIVWMHLLQSRTTKQVK